MLAASSDIFLVTVLRQMVALLTLLVRLATSVVRLAIFLETAHRRPPTVTLLLKPLILV